MLMADEAESVGATIVNGACWCSSLWLLIRMISSQHMRHQRDAVPLFLLAPCL